MTFRRWVLILTHQSGLSFSSMTVPILHCSIETKSCYKFATGAQVCIKTGYTKNGDVMVSKVAAGGGTASNTGAVFVYHQSNLRLKAVLCDEGLLTEVRTAAACAYASKFLLGEQNLKQIQKIGIVGGGVQAVWQLRLLGAALSTTSPSFQKKVVIKTTSRETAEAFIERMASSSYHPDREWKFEHYSDSKEGGEGFRGCQLIHSLTPSRAPVVALDDVQIGVGTVLHITAVGADSPGKMELDPNLIRKADTLICDSIPQSKCRGEFQPSEFWESLVEIGTLMDGNHTNGVELEGSFSIFDSSGLPLQDVEMANLVSEQLD